MQSLRSYLQRLEETIPDQLIRVKEEVDWRYEVTAYVAEAEKTMEVARQIMEVAPQPSLELKVPLKVDARAAENWEAAH